MERPDEPTKKWELDNMKVATPEDDMRIMLGVQMNKILEPYKRRLTFSEN